MSPDDIISPDTERRLQIAELASANNVASTMGLFSDDHQTANITQKKDPETSSTGTVKMRGE